MSESDKKELEAISKVIEMIKSRIEELNNDLDMAVGWEKKEYLRSTLVTNKKLLKQAESRFWSEKNGAL